MHSRRFDKSACLCLAVMALVLPACRKKHTSSVPPPPIIIPNRTEKPKDPPPLPPAPKIQTGTPAPDEPPVNVVVTAPPPEPPVKKAPPRRTRRASKKAAEVKIAEAPKPETPKVDPPQGEEAKPNPGAVRLGVILSPEERRDLAKRLDSAVDRTKGAVVLIEGKLLTKDQTETLSRIRTFLAQAEQTREEDLAGSVSLAERADLLSRDLLERLR